MPRALGMEIMADSSFLPIQKMFMIRVAKLRPLVSRTLIMSNPGCLSREVMTPPSLRRDKVLQRAAVVKLWHHRARAGAHHQVIGTGVGVVKMEICSVHEFIPQGSNRGSRKLTL